jgi:uncharacterized membrane protein YgdD (TMEM256/DUF423 family)
MNFYSSLRMVRPGAQPFLENAIMAQTFFFLGSLAAGLGVALGAFGAHGLKSRIAAQRLENFETAVRYQMYHALGLLAAGSMAAGSMATGAPSAWVNAAGWLFTAGIILFSGSLYLLVVTSRRWLGAITPLGGVAFLAGWLCLAVVALSSSF